MKPITVITGITALLIAGCAAFFSVTGLGLLFSGATIAVIVMASSLEIGKLVAAGYLHSYWKNMNKGIRTYMFISVIILILITSAGIFGFLSNAYSQTKINVSQVESKVSLYENQKERTNAEIERLSTRVTTLNDSRSQQEARYDNLIETQNWVNARRTTDQINESTAEINSLNEQLNQKYAEIDSLDQMIFTTQEENVDVEREIGGFRFVADAFGLEIDTVVKYFILLLIFVFDPLAVILVIAYMNSLTTHKINKKYETNVGTKSYKVYGEVDQPPIEPTSEENNTSQTTIDRSIYTKKK